jgi:hypothetical protein
MKIRLTELSLQKRFNICFVFQSASIIHEKCLSEFRQHGKLIFILWHKINFTEFTNYLYFKTRIT